MKRKASLIIITTGTIGLLFTIIARAIGSDTNALGSAISSFRYFTIQSNLIVVIYFWLLFSLNPKNIKFDKAIGGVIIYITVTFIVFALFLEPTWSPQGIELLGSILNHYVTPILSIVFLIYFRKDYSFNYKTIPFWLIYPLLYLLYVIIYGSLTNNYFYPFFEIDVIGVSNFIINSIALLIFFGILSIGVVFLSKKRVRE